MAGQAELLSVGPIPQPAFPSPAAVAACRPAAARLQVSKWNSSAIQPEPERGDRAGFWHKRLLSHLGGLARLDTAAAHPGEMAWRYGLGPHAAG